MKISLILLLLTTLCYAEPYTYKAEVLDVHDGDTIKARIDLGFDVSVVKDLRLLEVYAPEFSEARGSDCQKKLHSLIPVGIEIEVITIKTKLGTDKKSFDRYLAIVKYKGKDINKEMVDWLNKNKLNGGIGK